jgi:hypothetical protein
MSKQLIPAEYGNFGKRALELKNFINNQDPSFKKMILE